MGEIFERAVPKHALEWTGERLTTATAGQVEIEHLHRYFLARSLCRSLDVLDVASGEGYGSALLAQVARSVIGVELSDEAVAHAEASYAAPNLSYRQGDARKLPLDDASVDVVVSFETLEHFFEHEQFISEVKRVLRPGGFLILSSPDRDVYSPIGSSANPYHVHELSRGEFEKLLRTAFRRVVVLLQRTILGSTLITDEEGRISRTLTFERRGDTHYEVNQGLPRPPYNVAIASESDLPDIPNSIFIETSEIGEVLAKIERGVATQAQLQSHFENADVMAAGFRREIEVASDTIKAQVERAEKAEGALAGVQSAHRDDVERLQAELSRLDDDRKSGHAERERGLGELKQVQGELERIQAELDRSHSERELGLGELKQAQGELERVQAELDRGQSEFAQTQGELERVQAELERGQSELGQTQGELERVRAELERGQGDLARAEGELEQARSEWAQAAAAAADLQSRLDAMTPPAEAELASNSDQDAARTAGGPDLAHVEVERLTSELKQAGSALASAHAQLNMLRASTRARTSLQANFRLRQDADVSELRQKNSELESRTAEAESRAAEWEQRYFGLRRRLETILVRFGILGASRLFPRSVRAFVRNRVLGSGRLQ